MKLNLFCKIKDKDHNDSVEIKGKIRKRRGKYFKNIPQYLHAMYKLIVFKLAKCLNDFKDISCLYILE